MIWSPTIAATEMVLKDYAEELLSAVHRIEFMDDKTRYL